jgi:acyl-CoA thioesterase-1
MTLTLLRNRLIFRREKRDRKSFYPAFLAFCIFFACLFSIPSNAQDRDVYTLVVLGDSLSAGYGLADSESFPSKLEKALRGKGYDIDVINAGVSGDTTAGGLARLNWSVPNDANGVIVELGANDALRGLDPDKTYSNLETIISQLQAKGKDVLLAGMRAPPNMGSNYADRFDSLYPRLVKATDVIFYPFFLKGVVARPELNLDDGIHPNAKGIDVIVTNILPFVEQMLPAKVSKE